MAKKALPPKKAVAKSAPSKGKIVTAKVTKDQTPQAYGDFWEGPPNKKPKSKVTPAKVEGNVPAIYADTWKPTPGKSGLYLDTWMPEIDIKSNTSIYLDTWLPASVLKKTKKPGMYADTWVPEGGIKIKQRRGQ
jgi:hypothetical protein